MIIKKQLAEKITAFHMKKTPHLNYFSRFVSATTPVKSFESSPSRQLFHFQYKNKKYYLKRFTPTSSQRWYERLYSFKFFCPAGLKEFKSSVLMKKRNLPVIKPVAAIIWPEKPGRIHSLFVSEEEKGIALDQVISSSTDYDELIQLGKRGLRNLKQFHRANITFGATEPRNAILNPDNEIIWLDFERTKIDRRFSASAMTDVRRFLYRFNKDAPAHLRSQKDFWPEILGELKKLQLLNYPLTLSLFASLSLRSENLPFNYLLRIYQTL